MLTHIHIQNFTIVDTLSLDFQPGFNVLTGETGAGKSIWVDAVCLALGNRADSSVIRQNESHCDISVCFDVRHNNLAKTWLTQHNFFNNENECLIRRIIHREKPSQRLINGIPCSLTQIRELANLLISIHSQHRHQTLLKAEIQRQQLDQYANHDILLQQTQTFSHQWRAIVKKLETLKSQASQRGAELSLLRYQYEELIHLGLSKNEWQTLTQQHQRLHNAKQLLTTLNNVIDLAVDNEQISASQLLQQIIHQIEIISEKEPQLKSVKELLTTAAVHLEEAGNELNRYRDNLDLNPENMASIEQRLTTIHDLARKHHVNPENLPEIEKSLAQKILELENLDEQMATLEQEKTEIWHHYEKVATQLSNSRTKAAKQLNRQITDNMHLLGIQNGEFQIHFEKNKESVTPYGNESVQYQVITNPGQTFQPLQKIVSGGELSRISLALQVITAKNDGIPTLIFDEADVGIGGKTAEIIGKLLRQLGTSVQVLCITHLPQIAAQGHHHYKVVKIIERKKIITRIKVLNKIERIEELARMLSGSKITQQTRAHAEELLVVHE